MNSLNTLELRGFKSIKDLKINLTNLNIFIGPNGVGKSNFISFFSLLNAIIESNLQLFVAKKGGADTFLHFGSKTTPTLSAKLYFGLNGYFFDLEPAADNSLIFTKESMYFDGPHFGPTLKVIGSGNKEANIELNLKNFDSSTRKVANWIIPAIKGWKVYHFHDTSDSAPVKQLCQINNNMNLSPNGANLAAFLYLLKNSYPKNYSDIVSSIKYVAPFFDDFILRENPLNKSTIQLEWRQKGSDNPFLAHHLSDGTLRFILLATLLLQPDPPQTLVIDEPELGLHPAAINHLAGLIRSLSSERQIIVSTQSVTFLNEFNPEDVIVVDRVDDHSEFTRLDSEKIKSWMDNYAIGEIWEKNWIGGRP